MSHLGESGPVEHLRQPGTELLHSPANRVASGRLVHIVPLVLVTRIVMIVRPLVKAVKTQQFFALTIHLTCDLEGDPLVGNKTPFFRANGASPALNFRAA